MTEFLMPKLGHLMEDGTVTKWVKQVGDAVQKGDILLEVQTDKANLEVESPLSGVVREILVQPETTVPVGHPLCVIA